jgi:hypothetical protein
VPYVVDKTLVGEKVGEFFGGSLAVADVNGDGLDDLIVGAPLHTILHDEGRIYLFLANRQVRYVRFEVFTVVTMKSGIFWDVTPCGSCKNRRFGGTQRLLHQVGKNR